MRDETGIAEKLLAITSPHRSVSASQIFPVWVLVGMGGIWFAPRRLSR